MGLRIFLPSVLLCTLVVLNTNKAVEIEDSVLKQLLNTPAVIPTKNGYYIFVPSDNTTENGNQNQLAGPNSHQVPNQNNLIIVLPPNSVQSHDGNEDPDTNKKTTDENAGQTPNTEQNQTPADLNESKKPSGENTSQKPDSNESNKPSEANASQNSDSNEINKPSEANASQNPNSNENQKPSDSDGNNNSDSNNGQNPSDSNNGSNNNQKPDESDDGKSNDTKKPDVSNDGKKSDSESLKPEDSNQSSKGNEENKPSVPACCSAEGKKATDQSANANQQNANPTSDVKPLIPQSRGVNRASAESHCVQNLGIFDGPTDQASVDAMKKYNIDIVRIPLNQDCWLALNEFSWGNNFGDNYRKAVTEYVKLLRSNEIKVILDLHWSDGNYQGAQCNDFSAKCQKPMPDSYNSPNFWKSVANQFKDDDSIIFDLFNNPYPDLAIQDNDLAWKCWRDGGNDCFQGIHYNVAGMQDLVNAVRDTGANNRLMIGGLSFANDLSKWEQWVPKDPQNKIIASWHTYKDSKCNTEACWEKEIAPLAKKYPLIAGEIGEGGCSHEYTDKIMNWLDKQQISYLGWAWKAGDCSARPALVSDYNGTPTEYGKGILNHITNKNSNEQSSANQNSGSSNNSGGGSDDSCVCPHSANKTSESDQSQKPANNPSEEKPANNPTEEKPANNPTEEKPANKPSEEKPAEDKKPEEITKKKSLKGVNRASFEYSCVQNIGINEGPVDDAAIQMMKTWNIDIVRVPLNEDCWLGRGGHNSEYIGDKYRTAVEAYVKRLRNNGLKVIVDLHWTEGIYGGPGQGSCYDVSAKCQKPMPDMANAPNFWKSVATLFKDDDGIIFDIFNEPFPDMVISDKTQAWKCLRDGGSACPGFQFEVAGMQALVNAVRDTGAKNVIMSPGITWTNDLSRWLEFAPNDPANNLAASWHSYDFNACNNQNCWDSQVAPVAAKHPVYVGEIGEHGCSHGYVDKLMPWLDSKNINYLGWTWNNWDCSSGPALVSDYNGTPTNFGVGLRDHFKKA